MCGLVVACCGGEGVEEAGTLREGDLDGAEGRGDARDGVGPGEAGAFVAEVDGEVAADGIWHVRKIGRDSAALRPCGLWVVVVEVDGVGGCGGAFVALER